MLKDIRKTKIQDAEETPFDDSNVDFVAEDVQTALEQIENQVAVSASPGFSFGRNGTLNKGTYLYRPGGVVSSNTGINVGLVDAVLVKVTVATGTTDIFTVDIVQHDGNLTNLVVVASITIAGGSLQYIVSRSDALTTNKQLAVRVSPTSANKPSDLGVDVQLSGSVA